MIFSFIILISLFTVSSCFYSKGYIRCEIVQSLSFSFAVLFIALIIIAEMTIKGKETLVRDLEHDFENVTCDTHTCFYADRLKEEIARSISIEEENIRNIKKIVRWPVEE